MNTSKYIKFVLLNFALVAFFVTIVLMFFNLGHGIPYEMLFVAYACTLVVLLVQYPILVRIKSWCMRALIFFLSMNIFLFLYGEALCLIDDCIGDFPGLKMIVYGNMLGAFIGFFAIASVNYMLRRYLF